MHQSKTDLSYSVDHLVVFKNEAMATSCQDFLWCQAHVLDGTIAWVYHHHVPNHAGLQRPPGLSWMITTSTYTSSRFPFLPLGWKAKFKGYFLSKNFVGLLIQHQQHGFLLANGKVALNIKPESEAHVLNRTYGQEYYWLATKLLPQTEFHL